MRRLSLSLADFVLPVAAALIAGAAVLSSAHAADCPAVDPARLSESVEQAKLIVIGTVHKDDGGLARIDPEAFLKGTVSTAPIRPQTPANGSECQLARLEEGNRILAFLAGSDGTIDWPAAGEVFWLTDGHAQSGGNHPASMEEAELLRQVRALTNQYSVPAATGGEGASIDLTGTILPIGAAIGVILVVSLFLMRIWHRIDPS